MGYYEMVQICKLRLLLRQQTSQAKMSIRESLRATLKGTQGRRIVGLSLTALLLALVLRGG
jgi:hypothetical protein